MRPYAAEADLVLDSFVDAELAAMPDLYAELLADEPDLAPLLKRRVAESLAADAAAKRR